MKYTEADAQNYYNEQELLYRKVWAADGTTHWGYFEDDEADDLQAAGWLWSSKILAKSGIDGDSRVLEIGCGNGAVSLWLAEQRGCQVVGLDISDVRIENARRTAATRPELQVTFVCGSATELPFEDEAFTHVWAQGVLYHVPDLPAALAEVARVLAPRGVMVIDDFVRPEAPISAPVRSHFYERLKFEATYSNDEYLAALKELSLMPVEVIDMSRNIARTYALVTNAAESVDEATATTFRLCGRGAKDGEIAGYFYRCTKVVDHRKWVYESQSSADIATRYDLWAETYDQDMDSQYQTPERTAEQLVRFVEDKNTSILDVGCGTGLVGQALTAAGYTNLDGFDMSQEMLNVAAQKQCYRRLFQFDMVADPDVELYPVIVSAGCITFGHAPGYTLARLFGWLQPGGLLQITVRRDFMAQDLIFKTLLDGLRWEVLDEKSWSIARGTQHMAGLVLRKHAD